MGSYYLIYTEKWFTEISSRLEESPKLTSVKITANTAPLSISAISNSFLLTDPDSADSCTLCPDLPSPNTPSPSSEEPEPVPSPRPGSLPTSSPSSPRPPRVSSRPDSPPVLTSPISRDSPLCATEREELTPSRRSPRSPPSRNEYEIIAPH